MGSKNEAIGMKIGMDLTSISADGVALSDFGSQKCSFYAFFGLPLHFRAIKHYIYCLALNFGHELKFSCRLDHGKEQKWQQTAQITPNLHCFKATVSLNTSAAALYTYSKMTGVLETSAVTLSTFMKMTGSLKQA